MREPKLSTTGIAFIQNPYRAWTELGMPDRPGEDFGPTSREFTMPWPGHVERKKKKHRKKRRSK